MYSYRTAKHKKEKPAAMLWGFTLREVADASARALFLTGLPQRF